MGKASVKVEGGKMVNVEVENSNVKVTGDFFIEPAEGREEIESVLEKIGERASEEDIIEEVQGIDAQLIGFSPKDVVEAFQRAVDGGR